MSNVVSDVDVAVGVVVATGTVTAEVAEGEGTPVLLASKTRTLSHPSEANKHHTIVNYTLMR